MLDVYDFIRLVCYDLVLRLLVLRRFQEVDWSQFDGAEPAFLEYDFETG